LILTGSCSIIRTQQSWLAVWEDVAYVV
jgi:hypothetical protein